MYKSTPGNTPIQICIIRVDCKVPVTEFIGNKHSTLYISTGSRIKSAFHNTRLRWVLASRQIGG